MFQKLLPVVILCLTILAILEAKNFDFELIQNYHYRAEYKLTLVRKPAWVVKLTTLAFCFSIQFTCKKTGQRAILNSTVHGRTRGKPPTSGGIALLLRHPMMMMMIKWISNWINKVALERHFEIVWTGNQSLIDWFFHPVNIAKFTQVVDIWQAVHWRLWFSPPHNFNTELGKQRPDTYLQC